MTDIDPEILAARAAQAQVVPPFDVTALPTAEARALADRAAASFNDGLPAIATVEDHRIDGPGGDLRIRRYRPALAGRGAILYIHGGGWFACSVDTHDRMLRTLANEAGVTVFAVDFRLAPEHPFPAALHDCIAAWDRVRANAAGFGIDPDRIAVAGDSAGGNLALALAIDRRNRKLPMPAGGALLYACLAPGIESDSSRRYGPGGYGLTADRMGWYWDNYLGPAKAAPPALATPLCCAMEGLPPQFIGIAEADTIADESRLLYEKLRAAAVPAELVMWPGAVHGFLQMTRDVALARRAVRETALALAAWTA